MNTFTKTALIGAGVGAFAGTGISILNQKRKKKKHFVYPDSDMRNSWRADYLESPNAKDDPAEIGLTQLDSTFRSEWQGMGYPQTHRNLSNK